MTIGFDYYNTISKFPERFFPMMYDLKKQGNTIYVISAVGSSRAGTVKSSLKNLALIYGWELEDITHDIFEVVFSNYKESPRLKFEKCSTLDVDIFYDDRQDVVDLLNLYDILAFKVPKESLMRTHE